MIRLVRRFWELTLKELRQIVFCLSAAISQLMNCSLSLFLLGYAATMDLKDCPFAVLDRECTSETRAITAMFEHANVFRRVHDFRDEEDVRRRITDREVRMAILIPPNFTRSRQIDVITDGRNTVSAGLATQYSSSIFANYVKRQLDGLDGEHRSDFMEDRAWFNPTYLPQWFQIPGLLAQLLLLSLAMTIAISFAKERECGTFDQLRLTPYTPCELLIGKGLAGSLIGIGQFLFTMLIAFLWFRLPLNGSPLALLMMALAFITAAVGFGNLIASFCRSQQQAAVLTFVLTIPFTMLDGMTTPIACMPLPFQLFAKVNPVARANVALHKIFLEGADVWAVMPAASALVAIGGVCFFVAWLRFRKG